MACIRLESIDKNFGLVSVIRDLNLVIPANQLTVLLGPSGCGKSTLLRLIAGLEEVTAGSISIDGDVVNELGPKARGCAMVFQSYALYPHKTVYENLAFPLRMERRDRETIDSRVRTIARQLHIEDYLERRPRDLSGGQRQRVAMGRAMIRQPRIFLFDEPLSNLDAELRVRLRLEISRLQRELSATMIFVTHDQVEAMTLADSIVVMRDGIIQQTGAPLEIYRKPANRFVASFIGSPAINFVDVQEMDGNRLRLAGGVEIDLPGALDRGVAAIGIRPEHITADPAPDAVRIALAKGTYSLVGVEHLGDRSYAHLSTTFGEIAMLVQAGSTPDIARDLTLGIAPDHIHGFNAAGEAIAK